MNVNKALSIVIVSLIVIAAVTGLSAYIPTASAQTPQLHDRQTGKYLGNLSANPYDANSTSNEYGRYGSRYSADSVNNEYGRYGSRYSNDSANNPYATNPPAIYVPCYGC